MTDLVTFNWLTICREFWQSGEANRKRGSDWLKQLYRHNDASIAEKMAAHKDFGMSKHSPKHSSEYDKHALMF